MKYITINDTKYLVTEQAKKTAWVQTDTGERQVYRLDDGSWFWVYARMGEVR